MLRTTVKEIFQNPEKFANKEVTVAGWARTIRSSNAFGFIELNDGSYFTNLQVVFEAEFLENYQEIAKQNVGASLIVKNIATFRCYGNISQAKYSEVPPHPLKNFQTIFYNQIRCLSARMT